MKNQKQLLRKSYLFFLLADHQAEELLEKRGSGITADEDYSKTEALPRWHELIVT